MATLNWYLQIRNLSKTDPQAAEIFEQLQKAKTDEEKEYAKETAQKYIQGIRSEGNVETEIDNVVIPEVKPVIDAPVVEADTGSECTDIEESAQEEEKSFEVTDLSSPAFAKNLSKYGITREEELFLHGVFVRKMTRKEKILMRRSIYQKKKLVGDKIQQEYRQKRIEQRIKDANDPEKIRYNNERKYVKAIVDALEGHKNLKYIFSQIEGLTVEIFRELIEKPGIRNEFNAANPDFIKNFHKLYG